MVALFCLKGLLCALNVISNVVLPQDAVNIGAGYSQFFLIIFIIGIGFQPTRRQGRKYKEDDLTYNRNLLGHGDIEKVVSEEKIRQLSRSIMDVLWFSLWNKAE